MANSGDPILEAKDVIRRFGGIRAVDGASLDVKEGSITALIGPNGAGKTTLFNVITGFYPGERGSVVFSGRQIFRRRGSNYPTGPNCQGRWSSATAQRPGRCS